MAKFTFKMMNGWPQMTPVPPKEDALILQHLSAGERIFGLLIATHNQVVVATDQKLLIVKTGMMSGQMFGGKATGFDYRTIVGVEVRTGLVQGEFEVLAGGLANNQRNSTSARVNIAEQPNSVLFAKVDARLYNAMAGKIREMTSLQHSPAMPSRPQGSIADELMKFAALRDQGVLTEAEFQTRKAILLGGR